MYFKTKDRMELRDKLGLEEYSQHVYDNVSKLIINRNYISENQNFFNKLLFKMWEDYYYTTTETVSINRQISLLEIFLFCSLEEKPSLELPEDYL